MTATIVTGRVYADELAESTRAHVSALQAELGVAPGLATVMVGEDPSAQAYERRLRRRAGSLGCTYRCERLGADAQEADVLARVGALNADPRISGILLLRPVPPAIDETAVYRILDPLKDIESMHPANAGLFSLGRPRHVPSTPASVLHLLDRYLADTGRDSRTFLPGRRVAIVGRSHNVGQPAAMLFLARGATVIACDVHTDRRGELAQMTRQAEVLVVAAGVPGLVTAEHVSPGTIVVDVGINAVVDPATGRQHLVGDVDTESVLPVAEAVSPVPGGVGPITDICLVRTTMAAAELTVRTRRAEVLNEQTALTKDS